MAYHGIPRFAMIYLHGTEQTISWIEEKLNAMFDWVGSGKLKLKGVSRLCWIHNIQKHRKQDALRMILNANANAWKYIFLTNFDSWPLRLKTRGKNISTLPEPQQIMLASIEIEMRTNEAPRDKMMGGTRWYCIVPGQCLKASTIYDSMSYFTSLCRNSSLE